MSDPSTDFFGLRNTIANECGVCQRLIDVDGSKDETLEIAMFGAAQFAWCVGCGRKVAPRHRTRNYEKRWQDFARAISTRARGQGTLTNSRGEIASVMVGLRGDVPQVRVVIGKLVTSQTFGSLAAAEDHASYARGQLIAAGFTAHPPPQKSNAIICHVRRCGVNRRF